MSNSIRTTTGAAPSELDTASLTRNEMGAMLEILMYRAGGPGLEGVRALLMDAMPRAYWRLHGHDTPPPPYVAP